MIAIVRDVGRRVELADEGDAGGSGVFAAQQHRGLLAPCGFAMHLPGLAEDAREGERAEGVAAAIVAGDQRCVESAHQNVIPESRGVVQVGLGGGQRGGGPGKRKCMRAVDPVGLDHVAAFIHVQPVGGIGGDAWRVEHAGRGEGVARAPAHHLAAQR